MTVWETAIQNNVAYAYARPLAELGVLHGVTKRQGGVSSPPYDTLNLGWNRPEHKQIIQENYRRLCKAAGFAYDSMVLCSYCHGDGIVEVTEKQMGAGFSAPPLPPCDGMITRSKEVTLITLHADCMPVLLYDPITQMAGICHAGWKGTSLRIGGKMVACMVAMGAQAGDIVAVIGPSICPDCFEVDAPVMEIFLREFSGVDCIQQRLPKYHIDLPGVMLAQLCEQGVQPHNVYKSEVCTFENTQYFSYRRDAPKWGSTGAMAGFIRIGENFPAR